MPEFLINFRYWVERNYSVPERSLHVIMFALIALTIVGLVT